MKFLRPGFWQKVIAGLIFVIELALFIWIIWAFAASFLEASFAGWFLLAVVIYDLLLMAFILNTNTADAYKMSWLFIVGGLPFFGGIFYFVFANKKVTKRQLKAMLKYSSALHSDPTHKNVEEKLIKEFPSGASLSNYLEKMSGSGIYSNSSVEYFPLGDVAFPVMINELRKAKHYIFLEYFILEGGKFWDSILEVLQEKVKEGVEVKLMYDDLGSFGTLPVRYDAKLRKMGIEAHVFNRFKPFINVKMNNRDHRKIMVIDGHTAFTGGINLADEYVNLKQRFGHWKDNCIMVKGQAVYGFSMLFLCNWYATFDSNALLDYSKYEPGRFIDEDGGFPKNDGFVQPYGDLPFNYESVGERLYISIINRSKRYVYITTPYLIIDSELENALKHAALEGTDVRLLTPHIPDKKAVFQLTRSYYGHLLKKGVRIYEYTPGFVHEKMFVSDDEVATVGTINLDYRSLYLHFENGTLIVGNSSILKMKQDLLDSFSVSHEVNYEEWLSWKKKKNLFWCFLRLLAPFL